MKLNGKGRFNGIKRFNLPNDFDKKGFMMGGSGSGQWYRWDSKSTTESQHRVDIRYLKKQGLLKPGIGGSLSWSCSGEQTGSIRYRMESGHLVLEYRHRSPGGDWEPVEQTISFDRTPCFFGGHRKWFLCPRCLKRVAILYGGGKDFFCRHCYDLTYSSQQEGTIDRIGRKARKIRARLGASTDLFAPVSCRKPKGMHQKTFLRLREEADNATNHFWLAMGRWLGISVE